MVFLDRTRTRMAARLMHHVMRASPARTRRSLAALGVWLLAVITLLAGCSLGGSTSGPRTVLPSPTPTIETPEMQAARMVAQMSLDDKLGQMIIMQFYEPTYTANQKAMVVPWHPGGVILYNYSMGTQQQVKDLLAGGQKDSPIPMFTAIDEEGGYVDRFADHGFLPRHESAPQIARNALTDHAVPSQQGAKMASDMLSFGFNMDLAPVVDVNTVPSAFISGRTFGSTPDAVIANAGGWLKGLQSQQNVFGCLKHFPGIGTAVQNPHDTLPTVHRSKDQLEATEFAPYRALIQSGLAECVMSTDVLVPVLDQTYPSEISKATITGVLRDELHFNGVAITDALYMSGVSATWTVAQASVLAIEAGNDMVMAPWRPNMINGIITGLKAALNKGDLTQAQVDASVTRILALKIRYHILTPPGSTPSAPASPTASTPSADVPQPRASGEANAAA